MKWEDANKVAAAGTYLLTILNVEPSIRYSRFYGTDEADRQLKEGCGAPVDDEHMPVRMDDAVWQLEKAGIVQTTKLPDRLMDGEQDYLIGLTPEGEQFLESGGAFRFRDMDL